MDEFIPFYDKKYQFLYDFNLNLLHKILEITGLTYNIKETNEYTKFLSTDYEDFRDSIHPKQRMYKPDDSFQPPIYHQVFEPKYGFMANLSIIDLLFNTGPEISKHLINSNLK